MNRALPLAGLLLAALPALAAEKAAPSPTPYFVANCFNCHGTEGKVSSAIPAIAGRDKAYLEETLKSFKAGSKQATIMHQLAKGYTDEEIAVLADYFSRQK
ncbi:c-type cytochrome [Quatrionicoccus australiensis]|uniref:c-type cytochrome n=1 Tax=Quatrionicoccus australiensis TaxID=138118 RepID=UPI001CFB1ACA|nr:c-type cytochrome [Quatrionicoccus australiensis]MCB4358781.1 c-type cytochrome [Quatrionicoccus australiensis]